MTDTVSESPTVVDRERLAFCLSRVSSSRGRGLSARRFEILLEQSTGSGTGELADSVVSVWSGQFPDGSVTSVPARELKRKDLPGLVLAPSGLITLIVSSGHGPALMLDEAGAQVPADPAVLEQTALVLEVGSPDDLPGGVPRPDSVDWFRAAYRAHRGLYRDVVLASLVISLLGLVTAIYAMQVYDRVVPTGALSTLVVLSVGVCLSVLLEAAGRQLKSVLVDRSADQIDRQLSQVFFEKAASLRMESRPGSIGTLAAQIKGYEIVRQYMTGSFLFFFADLPFSLIFLAVIWALAGPLAYIPLALIPVGLAVGLLLRVPIERYTRQNAEEANRRNGLLVESLDGAETMKAVGAEWELGRRWCSLTDKIASADLRVRSLSYGALNAGQLMQQLTYVGVVAAGAYLVTLGQITVGALIACSILTGRALTALSQFPRLVVQSKQAKIALDGLDQMMALPDDQDAGGVGLVPDAVDASIRLERVVFGYDPARPLLSLPSLSIAPGERVAVLGPSGSGKTTLLRILSGLYRPGHGRVFFGERDLSQLPPDYIREVLGYVPQDTRLFSGSLRDNLVLGLPAPTESALSAACDATGLSEVIAAHPLGLGLMISEGGLGLSVGQRQLVGLTRALLARPRLLLLDEPTASMDARLERRVLRGIFEGCGPATVVLVTHKMSVLGHCDRVLVLDQGRVLLDGPRSEVLDRLSGAPEGDQP